MEIISRFPENGMLHIGYTICDKTNVRSFRLYYVRVPKVNVAGLLIFHLFNACIPYSRTL